MKQLCISLCLIFVAGSAFAYSAEECGQSPCIDCHSLSTEEAKILLGKGVDEVLKVEESDVAGLWVVDAKKGQRTFPLYVDYSKTHVVAGNIFRLSDGQNLTALRQAGLNRVDPSPIPLDDALVMGKKDAKNKIIVFTDPQCPYCKKLHEEMKKVIRLDPSIAFYIKMFPLQMHPEAYGISKTIVCTGDMKVLEDSFAGKKVPEAACETTVVDETIGWAKKLRIRSTPNLIYPDGRVFSGFKTAQQLIQLLKTAPPTEKAEAGKK